MKSSTERDWEVSRILVAIQLEMLGLVSCGGGNDVASIGLRAYQ